MATNVLSEQDRKQVFAALVRNEDAGMPVASARQLVAEEFGVSEDTVKAISNEGVDKTWPPLEQCEDDE